MWMRLLSKLLGIFSLTPMPGITAYKPPPRRFKKRVEPDPLPPKRTTPPRSEEAGHAGVADVIREPASRDRPRS